MDILMHVILVVYALLIVGGYLLYQHIISAYWIDDFYEKVVPWILVPTAIMVLLYEIFSLVNRFVGLEITVRIS